MAVTYFRFDNLKESLAALDYFDLQLLEYCIKEMVLYETTKMFGIIQKLSRDFITLDC